MKQYVVDVFTETVFHGNPTAVCFVEDWPDDEVLRQIAGENRLSETAFVRKKDGQYSLRWFTAVQEIPLCGHAALGAAWVVLRFCEPGASSVTFDTLSGPLTVEKEGNRCAMKLPGWTLREIPVTAEMEAAIGTRPAAAYLGRDLLCVVDSGEALRAAAPDMERVKALPGLLLNLTAVGTDCDCLCRSFAPKLGVPEDPACGSGQCHAFVYWAEVLGKRELFGRQASERGGEVYGRMEADGIRLSGASVLFSRAEILPGGC